jgi:hypothetical protein
LALRNSGNLFAGREKPSFGKNRKKLKFFRPARFDFALQSITAFFIVFLLTTNNNYEMVKAKSGGQAGPQ